MDEAQRKMAERYHELLETSGKDPETCAKQVASEFGFADWTVVDDIYDTWLSE